MHSIILIVAGVLLTSTALAENAPFIPVGEARIKKTLIAIPSLKIKGSTSSSAKRMAESIERTVKNDLSFMDLFQFFPKSGFIENASTAGVAPGEFKFSDWNSLGIEILLKNQIEVDGDTLSVDTYLYDPKKGEALLSKRYVEEAGRLSNLAHQIANDVVTRLTGLPGIFLTRIAMVCEVPTGKEIFVMNFDGTNVKQITFHKSIAFAPTWSPDGGRIAYSLYTKHSNNQKNIDLYEYNFNANRVRVLSRRKGINSGANYSPDGRYLALTMSYLGNPEIFRMDLRNLSVKRLTKSFGFDVDPSWSPDGRKLAFVSSRSGKPMVFVKNLMNPKERPKRLTIAGRYNATPSWSATNNKISFAGWIGSAFDIFLMNPDGSNIERLTMNQGNNEDPSFSPDGNFITFSSNRTGKKNIYVMNIDGTFVKRLTYGVKNCVSPKWSNPPR